MDTSTVNYRVNDYRSLLVRNRQRYRRFSWSNTRTVNSCSVCHHTVISTARNIPFQDYGSGLHMQVEIGDRRRRVRRSPAGPAVIEYYGNIIWPCVPELLCSSSRIRDNCCAIPICYPDIIVCSQDKWLSNFHDAG